MQLGSTVAAPTVSAPSGSPSGGRRPPTGSVFPGSVPQVSVTANRIPMMGVEGPQGPTEDQARAFSQDHPSQHYLEASRYIELSRESPHIPSVQPFDVVS